MKFVIIALILLFIKGCLCYRINAKLYLYTGSQKAPINYRSFVLSISVSAVSIVFIFRKNYIRRIIHTISGY